MKNIFAKVPHYTSIEDLPMYNWHKLQETNDLTWLMTKPCRCNNRKLQALEKVLEKITNEYIDTFGISDSYKEILERQRDIRVKEIEIKLTGQRYHQAFIDIWKVELETLTGQSKKADMGSAKVYAEKFMGRAINMRETTVKEFYSIIAAMRKEAKQNG